MLFYNTIDHASYVESLLKKNELSYPTSSRNDFNEESSRSGTSNNKSMDIGDHVVCLDDKKPTYGVIRDVYKTEGLPHAEVAFVSITSDILYCLPYIRNIAVKISTMWHYI